MNSRSHLGLPERAKEKVKILTGKHEQVDWSIEVYLSDAGTYFAITNAGKLSATTKDADDFDGAVSFGAECLMEFFYELGVRHAA